MRDDGFVTAFSGDSEIVQILQQLLVVADGQNDGGGVSVLVGEVLQGLAHGWEAKVLSSDVEDASDAERMSVAFYSFSCNDIVRLLAIGLKQAPEFAIR